MNSIDDIIAFHSAEGNIEDGYINIHLDEKILKLNTYTLTVTSNNAEKGETKIWNHALNNEIRKDRKLTREIKEFRVLFEVLHQLRIKSGYVTKMERPDFVLKKEDRTYGIEITQIYSGNDWAVEKVREDIKNYAIDEKELEGYLAYQKYDKKVRTYKLRDNLVIIPQNDKQKSVEYKVRIKNKIFEKVRKMFDDYNTYDTNIVIAKIMSPEYLDDLIDVETFGKELNFFVSHIEGDIEKREYILFVKAGKKLYRFNISKKEYGAV